VFFAVLLGRSDSDVLRVVHSLITSSYLDKDFTNDAWEMEAVTTLKNDFLEQQYTLVFMKRISLDDLACIASYFQ